MSGLRSFVLKYASCSRYSSIFLKFPESKTSGTFRPLYSAGLVYIGGDSKLS